MIAHQGLNDNDQITRVLPRLREKARKTQYLQLCALSHAIQTRDNAGLS